MRQDEAETQRHNTMFKAESVRDSEGQVELINRLITATTNPRDKAFISVQARTGIRITECVQLKESDIDFQRGTLTIVHLKERSRLKCSNCGESLSRRHHFCPSCGGEVEQAVREKLEKRHQRLIPVDTVTLDLLQNYLKWRRRFPYRGPLVFPFSRQRGWQIVERLGRRVGIKGLHPHSLRRFLATTWVGKGKEDERR
jgi:integrase/recombinase XerD